MCRVLASLAFAHISTCVEPCMRTSGKKAAQGVLGCIALFCTARYGHLRGELAQGEEFPNSCFGDVSVNKSARGDQNSRGLVVYFLLPYSAERVLLF